MANKLEDMSNEAIVAHIESMKVVRSQMVGSLYPAIITDKIAEAIEFLKKERNFSFAMNKPYTEVTDG